MVQEPFSTGDSALHRMDPRIKIVNALLFSTLIAIADRTPVLWLGAALSLVLILFARLPFRRLVLRFLVVNSFILLIWLFLPFSTEGTAVWHAGPLTATQEGIDLSLEITLKTNAIVFALTALLGTTTVVNLAHALDHLGMPDKLVQLIFFTWRYVHVVAEELSRLTTAMKVRCFRPRSSVHTYRSYAYLLGMLFVRSFDRSERIFQAMLCRGFHGFFPAYRHFALRGVDTVMLAILLMLIGAMGYLEWMK